MSKSADGPSAATFPNPRRSGWMHKHGGSGMSSHWRKRWFIVDHHYLFYYKGPNDKKPVGILCLPEYTSCHKVDSKEWKKPYTFMLDKGDGNEAAGALKNYVLCAESEKDLEEWIKVLTEEMQPVLGGISNGYPGRKGKDEVKIDQKAMDDLSKVVSEGPKLSHLTAARPKVKGRRPPKKYQVFHEDDEDSESPPNTPAEQRQQQPPSDSPSTSPSVSPSLSKKGHHPTVPLRPKARTSTLRVTEQAAEATESRTSPPTRKASKPLPAKPLPPKKPVKEPSDTALPAPLPQASKSPEPAIPEAEPPPSPKTPLKPAPPKKPPKDGRLDVEQEAELRSETKNAATQKRVPPRKPRPQPPVKPRATSSSVGLSAEPPPTPTPSEPPTPTTPTPTPTPRPRPVPRKRTKERISDAQEEVAEISRIEVPVEKPVTEVKSPEPLQPKETEPLPEEPPLMETPPPLPAETKPPPDEEPSKAAEEEEKEEEEKEEEEEEDDWGEGIGPPIAQVEENEVVSSSKVVSPEHQAPVPGKPTEVAPKEEGKPQLTDESKESDADREGKAGSDKQNIQSTDISSEAPLVLPEEPRDLALHEETPERKQISSTDERALSALSGKSEDSSRDDVFSPSYEQMKPASPATSQASANRLTSTEGEEDYETMQSGVRVSKEFRSPVCGNVAPGYDKPTNWASGQRKKSLEHQSSDDYELPPDADHDYDIPPAPRPLSGIYESPRSSMAVTDLEALKEAVGRNEQQQQREKEEAPGVPASPSSESRSSSSSSGIQGKLERDALGYTKVMKMKTPPSPRGDRLKPASTSRDNEDDQLLIPPKLPVLKDGETVPDCLQQAKEILRLARIVKAEAEEMKKEVLDELELAKKERCDAELLKRNAAEILRMSKEKLKTAAIVARH